MPRLDVASVGLPPPPSRAAPVFVESVSAPERNRPARIGAPGPLRPKSRRGGHGPTAGAPWRRVSAAVFLSLLPLAQHPSTPAVPLDFSEEWKWADFGPESGLPGHTVLELIELDGMPWVRTDDGLAYYDGFLWTPAGAALGLPAGTCTDLVGDGAGGLMVVVDGMIYRGGLQGFERVPLPVPFDTAHIVRALPDSAGSFYFTVSVRGAPGETPRGGLFHASGAGVERVETPAPLSGADRIWHTRSGRLWIGTWAGLAVLEDGVWRLKEAAGQPGLRARGTSVLAEGRGLGLAFRDNPPSETGLLMWQGDGPIQRVPDEGRNYVTSLDVKDGAAIVVYETGDLRILEGGVWRSFKLPQSRSDGVDFVRFGDDGDLWFGSTSGLHLFRASARRWERLRFPFPDPRNRINAILVDRDDVTWLATNGGVLKVGPRGEALIDSVPGRRLYVVTGLAQDSSGNVWLTSGQNIDGAYRWDGRAWHRFGPAQGLRGGRVHRVFVDRSGAVWFMTLGRRNRAGAGAYRLAGGVIEDVTRDLPRGAAYAFAEAADGTIWLGLENGLARVRGKDIKLWGAAQGLGTEGGDPRGSAVFDVALDGQGRVWFCHVPSREMGLGYIDHDGTVRYVDPPGGPAGRRVWSVTADADGTIWVGSDAGVAHLRNGSWALFDAGSGLAAESVWPIVPEKGAVLIGSNGGGFVKLDRNGESAPSPRVVTASTDVHGNVATLRWLAFAFRGETPEERVETRLRLDGGPWSPWGTARSWIQGDLSSGRHSVEIQAKSLFGRVSDPPLSVRFRVLLPFVFRPSFAMPVGTLLIALLVLGVTTSARRRRDEATLRLSEERWRSLVENAPEAIGIYDVTHERFTIVNGNAARLLGFRRTELLRLDPRIWLPSAMPDGSSVEQAFRAAIQQALAGETVILTTTVRARDGRDIPCEIRMSPLSLSPPTLRVSLIDIRERLAAEAQRVELEDQLRQAAKLEALGKLTGGFAHHFNNLLTVVKGNIELLRDTAIVQPAGADLAHEALAAVDRGAQLTQRLLAYSRRQTLAPRPLRIPALLDGILESLHQTLGEAITLTVRAKPDTWPVSADPAQLEQVIGHLCVNARGAMPGGGHVVLRAGNMRLGRERAPGTDSLESGDYVRLSVSDTGRGMPPAVARHAFDPFFTTAPPGTARGLGLSMVFGFAAQSGGTATIETAEGRGTTVSIYLPRHDETPGAETEVAPAAPD